MKIVITIVLSCTIFSGSKIVMMIKNLKFNSMKASTKFTILELLFIGAYSTSVYIDNTSNHDFSQTIVNTDKN